MRWENTEVFSLVLYSSLVKHHKFNLSLMFCHTVGCIACNSYCMVNYALTYLLLESQGCEVRSRASAIKSQCIVDHTITYLLCPSALSCGGTLLVAHLSAAAVVCLSYRGSL